MPTPRPIHTYHSALPLTATAEMSTKTAIDTGSAEQDRHGDRLDQVALGGLLRGQRLLESGRVLRTLDDRDFRAHGFLSGSGDV